MTRIKIGVSACLLGQKVRYDGKHKFVNLEKYFDPKVYQLIPICPEVEMGMSIPRPPIQIINDGDIKLVQVDNHTLDFTKQMHNWFQKYAENLEKYSGFILKSKSPSCGNKTTPHYSLSLNKLKTSDGFFVHLLKSKNSIIPLIDEIQVLQKNDFLNFIKKISKTT